MTLAFLAQAGSGGGGGGFLGFLPFILIMVIVYLMMIRPQIKKQKEHGAMLKSLSKNDEIITSGGLHGRIVNISEKGASLQVQITKGIIVTIERSSIARIVDAKEAKEARHLPSRTEKKDERKSDRQPRQRPQEDTEKARVTDDKQAPAASEPRHTGNGVVTTSPGSDQQRRHRPRRRSRRPQQRRDPRPKEHSPKSSGD